MVMNKIWYSYGNEFKVKFRNHTCYKCGEKLMVTKQRKVVDQKSKEAEYYNFNAGGGDGVMIGPCEFIHKVFYCPKCLAQIEFVTQLNFEDIDILIERIKQRYLKEKIDLEIKKTFKTNEGIYIDKVNKLEDIKYLCLTGYIDKKALFMYKFPLLRKGFWERPYYFEVRKKMFIKSIKKQMGLTSVNNPPIIMVQNIKKRNSKKVSYDNNNKRGFFLFILTSAIFILIAILVKKFS